MKKLLIVFGIFVWLSMILVGFVSFFETRTYNNLAAIAFVVIVPLLIIYIVKHKSKKNINTTSRLYTNKEVQNNIIAFSLHGYFNHVSGLNLAENVICEVLSYPALYEIKSGALKFNLLKSKVVDVTVTADTEIQKQYVSSIGGAVGGAVLFGPIGAIIGGRAKQKKTKNVSYYLIITYKNDADELKYIGFDVTNAYFNARKFVNEFKQSNNTITSVDL